MSGAADAGDLFKNLFEFSIVSSQNPSRTGPTCNDLGSKHADRRIAIIEFDDQGLCFDDHAMLDIESELIALTGRDPVIIVFAHGWKHNASAADDNLASFKALLEDVGEKLAPSGRPLLGVYMAWRGLSRAGNALWENSSFWDRREAAARVASGSARELLGRLKAFRNGPPQAGGLPRATLVVVGHSFGGLVVYTALAQSLIEAAATSERAVPSFGDLVLLVNPAFSAVSYLPVHEIIARSDYDTEQFPVFVSVTAINDWATGIFYPLGSLSSLVSEAWRGQQEREALVRTMGHIEWLRTHELSAAPTAAPGTAGAAVATARTGQTERNAFRSLSGGGREHPPAQIFGGVSVKRVAGRKPSPFWSASATPDIIDGHNGIFKPAFIGFVAALVAATLDREAPAAR
jgi:hypothetical protein